MRHSTVFIVNSTRLLSPRFIAWLISKEKSMNPSKTPVVSLHNISKRFPGVLAVDEVSLDIYPGEVHVVAGENGAGKSTLMKLLSQVERLTSGTVLLNGREVAF